MSTRISKVTVVALSNSVVAALHTIQVDDDKVIASINCAIGRAQLDGTKLKAGKAKYSAKTDFASMSEVETATFVSQEIGLKFYAWHTETVAMLKKYGNYDVTFPSMFTEWLAKHKFGAKSEPTPTPQPTETKPESQAKPELAAK
jgi:hypothetical protein